jgi:hypothetical protein
MIELDAKPFRDGCIVHKPLTRSESLKIAGLGAVLALIMVLSASLVGILHPEVYPVIPSPLQFPAWACLGGILGGAARSLYFMKMEFGGHSDYCPQWYMDKWSLYILKPFLGMVGGVALFLTVYVGFQQSFTDSTSTDQISQVAFFRILLTSLAGGMFFEGAYGQLQKVVPEERSPA